MNRTRCSSRRRRCSSRKATPSAQYRLKPSGRAPPAAGASSTAFTRMYTPIPASDSAVAKAAALIEAHRYIQRFRGKVVVVKVGGSLQEDAERMRALLTDVAFMSGVGMRPVIVHGGGKSISAAMSAAGLKSRFIQG